MKKIVSATLLAMALLLTGCGDSHDAVASDGVALMNEFASTLADVKDEASAKAAVPKLESLAARAKDLKERLKTLGEPTAEQEKELEAKYKDDMTEAMKKMMPAMMVIGTNPKIQQILQEPMNKFEQNMN